MQCKTGGVCFVGAVLWIAGVVFADGVRVKGRFNVADQNRSGTAERGAGAVLHTHSIWNTILSDIHAADGGLSIEGYEMLKGLEGVNTHEHREWLPILENSQDMLALADSIGDTLGKHKDAHAFLLHRHGLYSWGRDLAQAKRHV